jgi:uncharacterized phage-associated protein
MQSSFHDLYRLDYLLRAAEQSGIQGMTPMKLQKLLYFAEGLFLAQNPKEKRLFQEDFQAWEYGPVLPTLYRMFKSYGRDAVPRNHLFATPNRTLNELPENVKAALDASVSQLGKFSAIRLSDFSHVEGGPWASVFSANTVGAIIRKESMREYFSKTLKTG